MLKSFRVKFENLKQVLVVSHAPESETLQKFHTSVQDGGYMSKEYL